MRILLAIALLHNALGDCIDVGRRVKSGTVDDEHLTLGLGVLDWMNTDSPYDFETACYSIGWEPSTVAAEFKRLLDGGEPRLERQRRRNPCSLSSLQ